MIVTYHALVPELPCHNLYRTWYPRSSAGHCCLPHWGMLLSCICYMVREFRSTSMKLLLIRQSKSAMRSFYGLPSWSHTSPLYSRLNVQPLGQAAAKKVAFFVHRCLGGKCSRLFRDFFTPVHGRLTRGSEQRLLEIPFWPGPSGRANIKSYGAILWNTLPPQLRLIPTQSQFRQILKCLELPGY